MKTLPYFFRLAATCPSDTCHSGRFTPYSCRLIHAGVIHADLFMPDRFMPGMTDSCPYLFMPWTVHAPHDLFMPVSIHASISLIHAHTDLCQEDLFMPDPFHAKPFHAHWTYSCRYLFMPKRFSKEKKALL